MTLTELAEELGVAEQAVYIAAGRLIHRYGYELVMVSPRTGEITQRAEKAIRDLTGGVTDSLVMES